MRIPRPVRAPLLILFICFGTLAARGWALQDTIPVGGLWDLSGPHARLGKAFYRGARRGVEVINHRGGVLHAALELVAGDTKGTGVHLLARGLRLVDGEEVVGLMGPGRPELAERLRGLAELHKVPLVLTAGVRPILRRRRWERSWSFGCYLDLRSWARALFPRLRRAGVVRMGLLIPREEPWAGAGLWLKGYAAEGFPGAVVERYGIGDADVVFQLRELERRGVQAVVALGPRAAGAMIASSFRGRSMLLVAAPTLLSDRLLATAAVGGTRVVAVLPPLVLGDSIPPTHPCASAVMAFEAAMGGELRSMSLEERIAAGRGWDAIFMLREALRRAGAPSRSMVRSALESGRAYYGVTGIYLADSACHTRQAARWLLVREWRAGAWHPLNPERRPR